MATDEIRVWDPFVRVFHWSLVVAFTIAWFTEDDLLDLHVYAGYAVGLLVAARLVWGVVGTRHARFRDFVYPPAEVKQFLRDTLYLRAKRYIGHNPAGGAMIILMLLSLVAVVVSGIVLYGMEDAAGPLASLSGASEFAEEAVEEVHEFFANLMALLVVLHIGGVLVESFVHRENLAKSMITGRKRAR